MAAGAITGEQRLNIEVKLDTKGLKRGTAEYRAAMNKMIKSTKRANLAQQKLAGGAEHLRANNRGASAAIIELGRGASDARFGFHGLGNNLERTTELVGSLIKKNGGLKGAFKALASSLLGPAGVVAGITVLIAYGPQIINFFKGVVGASSEASEALDKFYEDQDKAGLSASDKEIDLIKETIKEKEKGLEKLAKREKNLAVQQKKLSKDELADRKAINKEILDLEARISSIINKRKEEARIKGSKKEQAKAAKAIALEVSNERNLLSAKGKEQNEILAAELKTLKNADLTALSYENQLKYLERMKVIKAQIITNDREEQENETKEPKFDFNVGLDDATLAFEKFKEGIAAAQLLLEHGKISLDDYADRVGNLEKVWQEAADKMSNLDLTAGLSKADLAFLKFQGGITAVKLLLDAGIITLDEYIRRVAILEATFKKAGIEIKEDINDISQALESTLTNAFAGLGQAIGDALVGDGDFGDKFLKILGGFMQAFGSAIIGVGVAALTLEASLFSGQPWLAIGAGVALVAAGAVLSGIASKGVDGQGGGARATPTATTTTPNSVQGAGGNGTLVATIRGQELRFLLQGANDSYGALS